MLTLSRKSKSRKEILDDFRKKIEKGIPIIGAGAGLGLSAKCEEKGGADLIVTYDSGRFRMNGRPSISGLLSFGDANSIVLELAGEVLPMVKETPVLAGVFAHDSYRFMDQFLQQLKDLGFAGVQNFPAFGGFEGHMRAELESVGYGIYNEVELVRIAHDLDLLTTPYVFNEIETKQMIQAGADILVVHAGCTTGGATGIDSTQTSSLEEAARYVQGIADYAHSLQPDILVLCHGGPIAEPEDAKFIIENTRGVHGFYGASSMERLPVERAITEQVAKFKTIRLNSVTSY